MRRLIVLLVLLLATAVWAADGDKVDDADIGPTYGSYYSLTYELCDGVLEGDTSCDEFDLDQKGIGMPQWFIFSREDVDSDCTGDVTIAINTQTLAGGDEHVISTLNNATTSEVVQGPRNRYIDADITNQTNCNLGATDTGVTVRMILYYLTNRVK